MTATIKGQAREQLLAAAEMLIARHGVDGVSIRGINAAAGVSPGILHYHFGGLEKVVQELVERHMVELMELRLEPLLQLQAQTEVSIRAIVDILIRPLARKVIEQPEAGLRYIRFLARLQADRNPTLAAVAHRYLRHSGVDFAALVQRAVPGVPRQIVAWRLETAAHALLHTLAELEVGEAADESQLWLRVETLIEFVCGGLAAPTRLDV